MVGLSPSTPDASAADESSPWVIELEDDEVSDLLSALLSEMAHRVLVTLHEESTNAAELAECVDTLLQNVQYHLRKFDDMGLVEVVDTVYSEKGREMKVYAPADRPLAAVVTGEEMRTGLVFMLSGLLGGVTVLVPLSALVQWVAMHGVDVPGDDGSVAESANAGAVLAMAAEVMPAVAQVVLPGLAFFAGGFVILLVVAAAQFARRRGPAGAGGDRAGDSRWSNYSYSPQLQCSTEHRAVVRGIGVGVGEDSSNVPTVVLGARDELLPIVITSGQAQAIQFGLPGEQFERLLTHDFLIETVTESGGAIDSIRIDDLSNDTSLAEVDTGCYHDGETRSVVFDARPSDAIVLAICVDCPILVSNEALDAVDQSFEASDADFDEWPGAIATASHDLKPP